jgi:hypothetical protein
MDDVNIDWYPHAGGARSRTLNSKESPAQPAVGGARAQRFRDLRLSHSLRVAAAMGPHRRSSAEVDASVGVGAILATIGSPT